MLHLRDTSKKRRCAHDADESCGDSKDRGNRITGLRKKCKVKRNRQSHIRKAASQFLIKGR